MKFRKVIFLSGVLLFTSLFSIKAVDAAVLNDITEDTLYHEDIVSIIDKGYMSGDGNGNFRPNDKITVKEAITVIERAYGNEENLPDWGWWDNKGKEFKSWDHDWYLDESIFLGDFSRPASRLVISNILIEIENLPLINPEAFGLDGRPFSLFERYYDNMVIRGYFPIEEISFPHMGMTRSEFCHLLNKFLNDTEKKLPDPEINSIIEVEMSNDFTEKDKLEYKFNLLSILNLIPEEVQKEFIARNGKVKFMTDDEFVAKFNGPYFEGASGVYGKEENTLFLKNLYEEIITHEFGHFLEDEYNNYLIKVEKLYKKDTSYKLASIVNDTYCMSNEEEYFAEGFEAYILRNEELKSDYPELFNIFEEFMEELRKKHEIN